MKNKKQIRDLQEAALILEEKIKKLEEQTKIENPNRTTEMIAPLFHLLKERKATIPSIGYTVYLLLKHLNLKLERVEDEYYILQEPIKSGDKLKQDKRKK